MARILITGAAGTIGTAITPRLRASGHTLRLLDLVRPTAARDDEVVVASAVDHAAMSRAAEGVDLLLHLASFPTERSWRDIVDTNIESSRVALDAAHEAGVGAIALASSVHAAGFVSWAEAGATVVPARPDTYYGFAKAAGEALASLYADRFGMRVVSLRIMNFDERPRSPRALGVWLSPDDAARLVTACLAAPVGHRIVWGVSANTRRPVSLEAGREIGYEPQDDAEAWAEDVARAAGFASVAALPGLSREPLGGAFTTAPLGERM